MVEKEIFKNKLVQPKLVYEKPPLSPEKPPKIEVPPESSWHHLKKLQLRVTEEQEMADILGLQYEVKSSPPLNKQGHLNNKNSAPALVVFDSEARSEGMAGGGNPVLRKHLSISKIKKS